MSYYWFNRQDLLKKKYIKTIIKKVEKKKQVNIIKKNKETMKKKARNKYKNLNFEEKQEKRQYSRNSVPIN